MKQATYIEFRKTTTLDTAPDYMDSLINEATEIMFNPKNFNRDGASISFSPGTW
jgi:ABC-type tungstate transport system permease subunit